MIFELRQYTIKQGSLSDWVKLMDEIIIPFQREMGMNIVGSFTVPGDEKRYIWIRKFNSEAQRKELYDKVYGSGYWQNNIRNAMGDMLIKSETSVTIMKATPGSVLQ